MAVAGAGMTRGHNLSVFKPRVLTGEAITPTPRELRGPGGSHDDSCSYVTIGGELTSANQRPS